MFRVKAILLSFCLVAVAASQLYLKGVDDGIASIDQEAFDSYTHFAKRMQHEVRKPVNAIQPQSVWAAIDRKGK